MALFDPANFTVTTPRSVCPVCDGPIGRRGAPAGRIVEPHDRWDQAMLVDVGNPCPGEGQLSVIR